MASTKALVKQSDLKRCLSAWKDVLGTEPCIEVKPDGTLLMFPADEKTRHEKSDWD